jgi:hypothetical protein
VATEDEDELRPDELTDELARKYDPERLLKVIAQRAGKGEALDHSVRARYEKRFGVDLSHVRVYSNEFAQEFNRKRNAYAVTVGATGIILMGGSPEKSMASAEGRALLAHELTHVAQQARRPGGGLHRKASFSSALPFAAEHEVEAEAHERAVLQEERGATGASAGATAAQRQLAKQRSEQNYKDTLEKVKERVVELFGETARNQHIRGGTFRRG